MIALLLTLAALQTLPNPADSGRFADFDLNEDGAIERDEVRARFDFEASAEATYQASRQSAKASAPRPTVTAPRTGWAAADAWFAAADRNGDGKLTRAELDAHLAASAQ